MNGTYGQIESSLQAAIVASLPESDSEMTYVYICDFSDTFVIYCQDYNEYLQDNYTIDVDGVVTLAGDPKPVKSMTTWVPTGEEAAAREAMETRGIPMIMTRGVGHLTASASTVKIRSEPVTYHRGSRSSYFRDFLLTDRVAGASDRLRRHAEEVDVISMERQARAWSSIHSGSLEYRVEPNRTDGQGGFFSPPMWLNELFATAKRPGRVLASLIPGTFPLPLGVSSINLPIITTGTQVGPVEDDEAVPDQDITDAAGSSTVVTLTGQADVALQLLEQSPAGAHLDAVIFADLDEAYGAQLEAQLIYGLGITSNQILGITNVSGINNVTFTSGSPTGSLMYPFLGQATAQIGDNRELPPEIWLLRTARWSWIVTQESTAGLPFGVAPFFMGDDPTTPDPIGGLIGWPAFPDDAIPANLGNAGNQDQIIAMRPSDLILLESDPQVATVPLKAVMTEVLSGQLGARIQIHRYVAAITNRYPSGISVLGGTGLIVQSGD